MLATAGLILLILIPVLNHYFPYNDGIASANHNFVSRVGNKVISDVFPSYATAPSDESPATPNPDRTQDSSPQPSDSQPPLNDSSPPPADNGTDSTLPKTYEVCGVPPHSQIPSRLPQQ
jgi:hypothetical protein